MIRGKREKLATSIWMNSWEAEQNISDGQGWISVLHVTMACLGRKHYIDSIHSTKMHVV
jgi:hypothetical protein